MNVIYALVYNIIINKLPVYIDGKPVDRRKKSFLDIEAML